MKIVADNAIPFVQHFFSSLGELQLVDGREIDAAIVKDADVLIVRTVTKVNEELLGNSCVSFVGSTSSGIDHIDTHYLQQCNISFAHAPGCNARSVAEYVLSSLFVLADQEGFKLTDKRVGIIGYGHVGKQVNSFLQSCGVSTLINDPPLKDSTGETGFSELDEVLQSDIITLHIPFTVEGEYQTRHLVNEKFLNSLSSNVILLNTSRGGVVDEEALIRFISQNGAAQLVLDVWDKEPTINTDLLGRTTINTPHIAGYSTDGKLLATRMVFEALKNKQRKESPTLPTAELAEITLDSFSSDLEALQMAVLSSYDVRGDSVSLQRILEISAEKRGVYFHELRNNYPVRREFSAMTVNLHNETVTLEEKLSALGFKVVHKDAIST